jgi:hypothetical protein
MKPHETAASADDRNHLDLPPERNHAGRLRGRRQVRTPTAGRTPFVRPNAFQGLLHSLRVHNRRPYSLADWGAFTFEDDPGA